MREMKDSGIEWIGEIPKEWSVIKNKYLISMLYSGGTPSATNGNFYCQEVGIPFVSISDMSNCSYVVTTAKHITESGIEDKKLRILPIGTILYSIYATVGAISELKVEATISQAMLAIQLNSKIDKSFYKYNLTAMRDYIFSNASGNTQFNLSAEKVRNFYFVLPTFSDQHRIADYLDDKCGKIDRYIEQQKQVIEKLKAYKQSVITEAVTKGLDPTVLMKDSGVEWIGCINASYAFTRIGRLCFVTKLAGFEYTNSMVNNISNHGEIPIIRAQNVRMYKFDKKSICEYIDYSTSLLLNRCSVTAKSLLMTFIGAGIGDVCVIDEKNRYHLAPNVAKIEVRSMFKKLLVEEFLMYYLGSDAGKGEISKISKASAQPSLSMETIRSIQITLPPYNEQVSIVKYLDKKCYSIDSAIEKKQTLIDKLNGYKKSVIYEVVTGKKEV